MEASIDVSDQKHSERSRFAWWDVGHLRQEFFSGRLLKGGAATFVLRGVAMCLALVMGILLARTLGTAGYGAYSYAQSWLGLLIIPACLGANRLLIRLVAAYQVNNEWELMSGVLRWSNRLVLSTSLVLALLAAGISFVVPVSSTELRLTFLVTMLLLPPLALTTLRQAALQGLHRVSSGQLPETLVRPLLLVIGLACAYYFYGKRLTPSGAVWINLFATCAAFVIGAKLLRVYLPQSTKMAVPLSHGGEWFRDMLPLLLLSGLHVVYQQSDLLTLGALSGVEAVGIYAVTNRGADLISFTLVAVNIPLAPIVSTLWAAKDPKGLQRVITLSARVSFLLGGLVTLVLMIWGGMFLKLFGPEFTKGHTALIILSIGQLANAFMGSVGVLLVMTRHEREAATSLGSSIILKLILCAILIPYMGVEGAAIARSASLIFWNVLLSYWVYRRLGINASALGNLRGR